MARHVLFLIHGIGQRAPDGAVDPAAAVAAEWWKEPVQLLSDLGQRYQPGIDLSLNAKADGIRIVPLSYGDLIVRLLLSWDKFGSSDVAGAFAERFPDFGAGRLAQLKGISKKDAPLFWSGPVDILLYRLLLDADIRTHVREQVARALISNSVGSQLPTCSFISHSMGTAVLHDTLAEVLAMPEQFGGFANMDIHLYASIANVSKVLQSQFNPHDSPLRPIGAPSSTRFPASVRAFLNAYNEVDPVALIGMFRPKWDPTVCDSLDLENKVLKWIDVHGLMHYLENPSIHIPIMRAACQITISSSDESKAVKAWTKSKGDKCADALEELRQDVGRIKEAWEAKGDAVGPVEVAVALTDFWRAMTDARAACGK